MQSKHGNAKLRKPDLIIGPRNNPQSIRWHLFVLRGWQLSLHKWLRSDDDRALHDHKGDSISLILSRQGFVEVVREYYPDGMQPPLRRWPSGWDAGVRSRQADGRWFKDRKYYRRAWRPLFRKAETLHRIELIDSRPVWTLWLRWPQRRRWGYMCPQGWRDADTYNTNRQGGVDDYYSTGVSEVGRGCD